MNDSLRFSIVVSIGLVFFAAFLYLSMREDNIVAFTDIAETYEAAYVQYESTIHNPGAGSNRARQSVGLLLNNVLMGDMSSEKRKQMAAEALTHVDTLDRQVMEIAIEGEAFIEQGVKLRAAAGEVRGLKARKHVTAMTDIDRERTLYIEELEELLASMNTQTRSIFERILSDKGEMTSEHVASLNNDLDGAETQYDRLSSIYRELSEKKKSFEEHFFEIRVLKNK